MFQTKTKFAVNPRSTINPSSSQPKVEPEKLHTIVSQGGTINKDLSDVRVLQEPKAYLPAKSPLRQRTSTSPNAVAKKTASLSGTGGLTLKKQSKQAEMEGFMARRKLQVTHKE